MKRLLLIVLPLLLIDGSSEVEGQQQQLIPVVTTYKDGNISGITYHKKTQNGIQKVKEEGYFGNVHGQKKYEGTFKNDLKDGKWTEWRINGQKSYEGTYKDGELDGLETRWYNNGQKKYEWNFKVGKRISFKEWNEDGSVKE